MLCEKGAPVEAVQLLVENGADVNARNHVRAEDSVCCIGAHRGTNSERRSNIHLFTWLVQMLHIR